MSSTNIYKQALTAKYDIITQYGTEYGNSLPVTSSVLKIPGYAVTVDDGTDLDTVVDFIFGFYDPHSSEKNGMSNVFTLNYSPIDGDLIQRALNLPGGSGTIEETLFFIERTKVNNIAQYRKRLGCMTRQNTGQINRNGFKVNHIFEARSISDWSATHGLPGTPDFVSLSEVPTTAPLTHLTPGVDPCSITTIGVVDISDFRWDAVWELAKLDPNGEPSYKDIDPAARRINLTLTSWIKDSTLKALAEAHNEVAVSYKLTGGGSAYTLTFNRCKFSSYRPTGQAGQARGMMHTLTGIVLGGVAFTGTPP
jgi:hypothetical protein